MTSESHISTEKPRAVRTVERALMGAGMVIFIYAVGIYTYGRLYQTYLQWAFVADPPVIRGRDSKVPLLEGMPLGKLEIPRLNLSVMVLEGVQENTLQLGASHIPQTSLPGNSGNVGIAAHRDTFFRSLRHIQKNDLIRITTRQGVFDYFVEWTRIVKPTDVGVLAATDKASLTLVTCYPFYYIGTAPDRFIVRAIQTST